MKNTKEELDFFKEVYGEPGDDVTAGYLSDGIMFIGDFCNTFSENEFYHEIRRLKSKGYHIYDEWNGVEY